MSWRAAAALLVAALCAASIGCLSKQLSWPLAATLIAGREEFNGTIDGRIAIGRLEYDPRLIGVDFDYRPLVATGVVRVRRIGKMEYLAEVTDHGSEAAKSWVKTTERVSPEAAIFHIPIAERTFVAVTRVSVDRGGTQADADFDWKWMPLAGAGLLPAKVPDTKIRHGKAAFRRSENGWRVMELRFGA